MGGEEAGGSKENWQLETRYGKRGGGGGGGHVRSRSEQEDISKMKDNTWGGWKCTDRCVCVCERERERERESVLGGGGGG